MNYRRKSLEEIPEENTVVWTCTNDECKGWMRDNFAFDHTPSCRLCDAEMVRETKMLPLLVNTNDKHRQVDNDKESDKEKASES